MRLIDADKLKTTVECAWLTAQDKMQFCKLIDNAPTVNDCPKCEYKKEYDYISSSSSYKELQALRKFKKDNERPQGEWKLIRVADHCGIHDSFVCPFCNYEREYRKKNFCEECGADLRGDNDDG